MSEQSKRVRESFKGAIQAMTYSIAAGMSVGDISMANQASGPEPSEEKLSELKLKVLDLAKECQDSGINFGNLLIEASKDVDSSTSNYITSSNVMEMCTKGIVDTYYDVFPEYADDIIDSTLELSERR